MTKGPYRSTKPCPGCGNPIPSSWTEANCVTCYIRERGEGRKDYYEYLRLYGECHPDTLEALGRLDPAAEVVVRERCVEATWDVHK